MSPSKLVFGLNHELTVLVGLYLKTILVSGMIGARLFVLVPVLMTIIPLSRGLTSTSTTTAGLFKVSRSLSDVVEEGVRAKVLCGVLNDLVITTIDRLQDVGTLAASGSVPSATRRSDVIILMLSVLEGTLVGRVELGLFLVLEPTTAPTITTASSWAILVTTSTSTVTTSTSTETTSSKRRSSVIVLVVDFVREPRPVLGSLSITSSLTSAGTTGFIFALHRTVLEALGNVTVAELW